MSINGIGSMMQMMRMQPPSASGISDRVMGKVDKDGDGVLSSSELSSLPKGGEMLLKADADGDGSVTQDELISKVTEKMDAVKESYQEKVANGEVPSIHEFKAMMAEMSEQLREKRSDVQSRREEWRDARAAGEISPRDRITQFLESRGITQDEISALMETLESEGFRAKA